MMNLERLSCPVLVSSVVVYHLNGEAHREALSYAWGDPAPCRKIICSGLDIQIAKNLYQALRCLRLDSEE